MAHSLRSLRIIAASGIALLLIGGSYVFSGPNPFFGEGRLAIAQTSEELLREYATRDTDSDQLPDWQEALYGTDPNNPESFQAGITDGEAVAQGLIEPKVAVRAEDEPIDPDAIPGITPAPTSLTDRFAQALLTQYLTNRGTTPPTQEEILGFVQDAVANLTAESETRTIFSQSEVTTAPGTLTDYAARAEAVFATHTISTTKNELSYFADALKGDDAALEKVGDISDAYAAIGRALIAIPVPPEAQQAHLSIANGLMRMSEVTEDMATINTDPVRALMGIAMHEKAALSLASGFTNLGGVFNARGIVLTETEPGFEIYYTATTAQSVTAE